jgi:FkbM family methyltransferase
MNAIFRGVKEAVEQIGGCRIYRNSLPHGVDCFFDIGRRVGRDGIKTVFDVGANVGQSALRYLREFQQAEIYSFEPVSATYRELVAATGKFPRIHTYKVGMGRKSGEAVINVNPVSVASSIKLKRPEDQSETITVETIAGFVETHQIENIDFLKVDTEGYDIEVLSGAAPLLRNQRVHFIMCECSPVLRPRDDFSFVDFASLAEFLDGFGYQVFGVYEQQPEWDGRNAILFWNVLFICQKLVACGTKLPNRT